MTTLEDRRSCCRLPQVERETYYAAAIAWGMIATAGTIILISSDTMGHLDKRICKVVACIPFLGAKLIQRFSPEINSPACCFGAAMGITVPVVFGISPISFAVGSVVGGVAAGLFADKLKFPADP